MSFSEHASSAKNATLFYGLLFTAILPPFFLFISKWFVPTLRLPELFTWVVLIGCIGQLIAVWTPGITPAKALIHNIAAYTMHTLLIVLVFMIGLSDAIPTIDKITASFVAIYMITVWCTLAFVKSSRASALHLQASYVAMFHVSVLAATYIR